MIRIPSHHKEIKIEEPYATRMVEHLKRFREGNLTEEELKQIDRTNKILSMYKVVWVD